jgi:sulfoxide reductase heme-binding subunit YedZ
VTAHERRIHAIVIAVVLGVELALGLHASASHAVGIATGGAALTLLLSSLVCSPIAIVASPVWSVALRSARRRLGIASAIVAALHASLALPAYVEPLTLAPIATLPWLRHGALALAILLAMLATSFPRLTAALRVRAWSALHRLGYAAALLGSLHALAVPFGSVRVGVLALSIVAIALAVRICLLILRPRRGTRRTSTTE